MFRIVSDVHTEFMSSRSVEKWLARCVPEPGQRVLILAGDIFKGLNARGAVSRVLSGALARLARAWPHVAYLPGNHEGYGTRGHRVSLDTLDALLEAECARAGVVWLQKRAWDVPGTDLTLVGCTLWSDADDAARDGMNDACSILSDTNATHADHVAWLAAEVRRQAGAPQPRRLVVVTHHLPAFACIHPKNAASTDTNRGYATDLPASHPALFEPPVVAWVHGHSHESTDVRVGSVRVVCNPTGYPGESKETKPSTDGYSF
jgi:hypothetical protein